MVIFIFTKSAYKKFQSFPQEIKTRIIDKLKTLKERPYIFNSLKKLTNFEPATHRLRLGDYRLIIKLKLQNKDKIEFLVLDVGHRKDIYR